VPTPTRPPRDGTLVATGTVLLTGLAAGALCCLLALLIKLDPAWLMLPSALGIGAFVRWQGYRGARAALIAATAMLLGVLYTEYLYAAVRMADMLGFPLRDTLFKMDWRLAWQITEAHVGASQLLVCAFAILLAVVSALLPASNASH
jgi:hypothetical protein